MARIRLLHWRALEAAKYLALLTDAGHTVEYDEQSSSNSLRAWREFPPDAFVIDLSRVPSHGREFGIALRQSPKTRRIPLIFCEGAAEKVDATRAHLPDAIFCTLSKLKTYLRAALRNRPQNPAVPVPMMQRFAARTTAQKLGIKEGDAVCVVDAPRGYLAALGALPPAVEFQEEPGPSAAVTLCFAEDLPSLQARMSELRHLARATKLWFCWRKGKAAAGGVSDSSVRDTGIALGLVDYKICSVNEVWSAMLFALKR
jgi:CheY-like chemotaxis protein